MLNLKEGMTITVDGHHLLIDKIEGPLLVLRAATRFPLSSNALLEQLANFKHFSDYDVQGATVRGMDSGTVGVSLSKKEEKQRVIEPSEQAAPVEEQAYV